jgi:hypothetical protein
MERQSSKHNPRLDDALKKGAEPLERTRHEPRAQESREAEPAADGERTPEPVGASTIGNASLTHDEVGFRQELARFLDRTIWPATRDELLRNAAEHGATDRVMNAFSALPARIYDGFPEVWETVSGHREPRKI